MRSSTRAGSLRSEGGSGERCKRGDDRGKSAVPIASGCEPGSIHPWPVECRERREPELELLVDHLGNHLTQAFPRVWPGGHIDPGSGPVVRSGGFPAADLAVTLAVFRNRGRRVSGDRLPVDAEFAGDPPLGPPTLQERLNRADIGHLEPVRHARVPMRRPWSGALRPGSKWLVLSLR